MEKKTLMMEAEIRLWCPEDKNTGQLASTRSEDRDGMEFPSGPAEDVS